MSKVTLADDPQAEKERKRADAAITIGAVLDRYLAGKKDRLRPRSYVETERHLRRDWAPLHGQPITKIDRSALANQLGILAKDNGSVAADRARAALSAFFSWAMREGLVANNPVIGTNRPATPKARDRVLTDNELAEIWQACRDDDYGRVVRLLILTGQRREEVAGMSWSEIDADKSVWSLPGSRTKNHRPHEVPLSEPALAIIGGVAVRSDRDFLFGEGDGPFSGWSKAKTMLDERIAARGSSDCSRHATTQPWRLHDIRRSVATRMADIGIQPHIIEAVLNSLAAPAPASPAFTTARSMAPRSAPLCRCGETMSPGSYRSSRRRSRC